MNLHSLELLLIAHCFWSWLVDEQATCHYIIWKWLSSLWYICVTRPQCTLFYWLIKIWVLLLPIVLKESTKSPLVVFNSWGTSMWPYWLSIGSHWHPHPCKLPRPDRSITNRIWADYSRRLGRLRDASLSSLIDELPWGSNVMIYLYRHSTLFVLLDVIPD